MYNLFPSGQSSAYQIAADIKRGDKTVEKIEMVRCKAYRTTHGSNFAKQVQSILLHAYNSAVSIALCPRFGKLLYI